MTPDPRLAMKLVGAGRVAIGLGLVVAPGALGRGWVGDAADDAGGQVALRALGIRDALLGFMAFHVADATDPLVAARWSAAIAICDTVDGGATLAAAGSHTVPARAQAITALAFGTAATGFAIASALRSAA